MKINNRTEILWNAFAYAPVTGTMRFPKKKSGVTSSVWLRVAFQVVTGLSRRILISSTKKAILFSAT